MLEKQQKRIKRHKRVRARIKGTAKVPRLCVFRSNKHIYAQLIDDEKGITILSSSDLEIKSSKFKAQSSPPTSPGSELAGGRAKPQLKTKNLKEEKIVRIGKIALAYKTGSLIAEKALKKKIKKVVFDRGGYKYHGRVKAIAEGARDVGLKF